MLNSICSMWPAKCVIIIRVDCRDWVSFALPIQKKSCDDFKIVIFCTGAVNTVPCCHCESMMFVYDLQHCDCESVMFVYDLQHGFSPKECLQEGKPGQNRDCRPLQVAFFECKRSLVSWSSYLPSESWALRHKTRLSVTIFSGWG